MKKLLLILLCLPLLFSCVNDAQTKKINKQNIKDSLSENVVIGFSVTSKNSKLTSKTGTDVSTSEMITKSVDSGDKILFKNFQFTLDNRIEGALNFYSNKGKLMCNIPTELSVMSMPPDGSGATIYKKGDNIEFSGISLIKINSINFVISDIRFNDNTID
jgi:hypothetical protein|tara:strand:+ start:22 stop:501 length:480 start_codon:yes stop_codon:yes gene_type:complete